MSSADILPKKQLDGSDASMKDSSGHIGPAATGLGKEGANSRTGSVASYSGDRFNVSEDVVVLPSDEKVRWTTIRNFVGFWLLGLCNNYAYVIMLSAAYDILYKKPGNGTEEDDHGKMQCNPMSTGAILLADILPALAVKLVAPFLVINTHLKVFVAVVLTVLSFLVTSLSVAHWMSFLGVVCAALASGLGEVTFLAFSSHFDKNVVSTWSSGTGGAGVIGALSYTVLTTWLSPRHTLQVLLVVPFVMAMTFWVLIVHPRETRLRDTCCQGSLCGAREPLLSSMDDCEEGAKRLRVKKTFTFKQKLKLTKPLLKYMIPLSLVYFAEYFINQGLFELIYFPGIWLGHKQQYRWYQVVYQIGVFISRSSVNIVQVKRLWILPILQFVNAIFLLFEAGYAFVPSIWIVLAIVLVEGLLGGCAYVNTFYMISQDVKDDDEKEFSMGVASLADSMGIALAGGVSIPVHDALCRAVT